METRIQELETFKRQINLTEYAAAQGYEIDRKDSGRCSVTMRGAGNDKIIIARDASDGHWVYFSVRDEADQGSIIDFIQHRTRLNFGQIRQELRGWVGNGTGLLTRPAPERYVRDVEPIRRDGAQVRARFAAMRAIDGKHAYLEAERGIPAPILADPRFRGKVFIDGARNAVFPHYDREGLCGFEIRNTRFKGFSKGGQKGLWFSACQDSDHRLVITESAIEALSYHTLHQPPATRYFSVAGTMNPMQRLLLASAFQKLPQGASLVIATNQDAGGLALLEEIGNIARDAQPELAILEHRPDQAGMDWNDQIKTGAGMPLSAPTAPVRSQQRVSP